ncbi:hypothetical protein ACS5NO_28090 [Larkinella sp. GY13]|uniref:hypothetical protein n=1 Tax=Larkinella sp. GY13 TaxID=3453720 RepID=UPI003EEBD340
MPFSPNASSGDPEFPRDGSLTLLPYSNRLNRGGAAPADRPLRTVLQRRTVPSRVVAIAILRINRNGDPCNIFSSTDKLRWVRQMDGFTTV